MGMSVDVYLIDIEKLINNVRDNATRNQDKLDVLLPALSHFGHITNIDGQQAFILLNCEYWSDENSYFELMDFIGRLYGIEQRWEMVNNAKIKRLSMGANAEEVAEDLRVELPEDEE